MREQVRRPQIVVLAAATSLEGPRDGGLPRGAGVDVVLLELSR